MHALLLLACILIGPPKSEPSIAIRAEPIAEAPPAKEAEPAQNYRWVRGDNPDQIHLFKGPPAPNGLQIGTWVYSEKLYHTYRTSDDSWGEGNPLPRVYPKPPAKEKRPETHPLPEMPKPGAFAPTFRVRSC